jgi:hypothetical protein
MKDLLENFLTLKNEHSLTYVKFLNIELIGAFSKRIALKTTLK